MPECLAQVMMSEEKSCSTFPSPTSLATTWRVAEVTGITTPSSCAASRPRSRSFSSSTLVNVALKSRFTSAGDLYLVNGEPITESLKNLRKSLRRTPAFSASSVISMRFWITTPSMTLCAILTMRATSPSPT